MNELALPRAILMDLKTGQRFDVNLQSDINPWPTEPDEEEPAQPMVFTHTFTVKTKKVKPTLNAFNRLLRKQNKLPRKLKKAFKHIHHINDQVVIEHGDEKPFKYEIVGYQGFIPNSGYPRTKWIRKAIRLGNKIVAEAAARYIGELEIKEE